jgi:ATP-binding cassette subfamily B protein
MATKNTSALKRLGQILELEKKEITNVYFFAILSGLVQLSLPLGVQSIIGLVMGTTMVTSIYILISVVVIGVLTVGLMQINQMKVIEKIQQRIFTRYAFKFAQNIPQLKLNQTNDYYLPEKTNRFFETITLQKGLSKILLDMPIASIQIVFGLILLSIYHSVFILLGILLVLILWLMLRYTGMHGLKTSLQESGHKYAVAGWLEELARVILPFKFSNQNQFNLTRADKNITNYLNSRTSHFKVLLFQYKVLVAFKVVVTACLLAVGTYLVIKQQLNIGEFIAAEIVILTVIGAVEKLISSLDSVYDVITGIEKLATVTELETEKSGSLPLTTEQGLALTFKEVSYEYVPGKTALAHLNLTIPANAKVGIWGNDGSGKSTLLKLMASCYDDYTGQILVNNLPMSNYQLGALREQISICLNTNDLFLGTVLENVSMGDESITPEKIMHVATQLGMQDLLQDFPKGFDSLIDPTGKKLSVSTTKKLLLLRVLSSPKPLIVLSEPWSGLNEVYTQNIINYMLRLTSSTVVIATTNKDYLNQCSHTITLSNGQVSSFKSN